MYSLSLQQIEYFLTVAERESISEAARVLFVSQPTVTKWMNNLEKELDTRLFLRRYNGIELTAEGRFLYERWRGIIDELYLSINEMHEKSSELSSALSIGCLSGYDYDEILPPLLAEYRQRYPNVEVSVLSYGFRELREKLRRGELDCIFTMTFDLENLDGFSQRLIRELPLYIVISAEHPLAQRESLDLIDVRDEIFYILSPDESSLGGGKVIAACERAGFTPATVRYVPNLASMAMAIKQNNGVTISSDELRKGNESKIKLFPTPDLPIDSYVIAAWKGKEASGATRRLIELTKRV